MAGVKDVKQNIDAVTMELGGKVRTIQFDMNAFAELENRFGTVQKAMKELQKGRMNDVRLILWTGLIHEEAVVDEVTGEPTGYNITPYQVGSWIKNPSMMQEAGQKLNEAMGFSTADMNNLPDDIKEELRQQGIDVDNINAEDPEVKND